MKLSIHGGILVVVTLLSTSWLAEASVIHVTPQGNDTLPGTSWDLARKSVNSGLVAANSGDEIWVGAGTYKEHIKMKSGVALYGGFAGNESTRAARNWTINRTILDGTTNGVVVTFQNCGADTLLDGCTIQNGSGTGIYCLATGGAIRNNIIRGNVGNDGLPYGGGISVWGGPTNGVLVIESNRVTDNANLDGGGIACIDASPRIQSNVITWNLAYQNGGGISCWRNSSPLIANNIITGNTASWVLNMPVPVGGGGIYATADDLDGRPHPTAVSALVVINNVLAANGAWLGGGAAFVDSNGGVPTLSNNTIVANNGSGIYWGSSSLAMVGTKPMLRNNLVAYNPWGLEQADGTPPNPNIEFNCVFGNQVQGQTGNYRGLPDWTGTNGNISLDPHLANYKFGNLHLQPDSPCIDAGKLSEPLAGELDLDGQNRVQGKSVDIGADESDGTVINMVAPVIHVSLLGNDLADGQTWATAKRTVQSGIELAKMLGGEVWVAAGTYSEHIVLPAFVYLYGGFAGAELDRANRNVANNPTILDGGGAIKVVQCGNAGFLVSALDGFTIQNGGKYTAGGGLTQYGIGGLGGGIYIGVASPFISHNLITHNSLAQDNSLTFPQPPSYGAGIYCELSYAIIQGNTIQENEILNTFDGSGAGIYCTHSQPIIEANTLARNHALMGSAIYAVRSSPLIRNNLVESNAMYNTYPLPLYLGSSSGAITLSLGENLLVEGNVIKGNSASTGAGMSVSGFQAGRLQNNLILNNRAYEPTGIGGMGGGIYCLVMTNAVQALAIVHNTIVSNVASNPFGEEGGAIALSLPPPADKLVIANNLMISNSSGIYQTLTTPMSRPTLRNNDLLNARANYINLAPETTDISRDPLFRNPASEDYRLQTNSPALDAGTPLFSTALDKDGFPRPLDGTGDGVALPDLGAYELLLANADSDHDGMPDGWEWDNGLNPAINDATQDLDGDGMSNIAEWTAGTDPANATSVLRFEKCALNGSQQLVLRWPSVAGRIYRCEFTDGFLPAARWQTLDDNLVGTGEVLESRCQPQDTVARFYRIEVRTWMNPALLIQNYK